MRGLVAGVLAVVMFAGGAAAPAQAAPGDEVVFADARLKECVALQLKVSATSRITVGQMESLTYLGCISDAVFDISPLRYAKNITTLTLQSNQIKDLSPLSKLTLLKFLTVDGGQVVDARPLAGLTKLTFLSLSDNQIVDVSPLAGLSALQSLDLIGNRVVDVSPLASMTWLKNLWVSSNLIENVSPLASLRNLDTLSVGGNKLRDVSSLAVLTSLTDLNLGRNQLTDVASLARLTNLTKLSLYDNQITDISPLVKLTKMENLYLYGQSRAVVNTVTERPESVPVVKRANGSRIGFNVTSGTGSIAGDRVTWTAPGTGVLSWEEPVKIGWSEAVFSGRASYKISQAPKVSGIPKAGVVGVAYDFSFVLVGDPKPTTTVIVGKLPEGLSLNILGKLSGVPTKAGTYTFTIEAKNTVGVVSAKYTLKVDPAAVPPGPVDPTPAARCKVPRKQAVFTDVAVKQRFYREIDWMHCMKLSTGYADKTYRPKTELSREAMAAFMFRLQAPKSYTAPAVSPFTDVPTTHKFYKEISWMKQSKLSTGYADGSYRPKENLSREAMAAFIYRLEATTSTTYPTPTKSPFADVSTSDKFYKEISWMKQAKLSTGYADGTYAPKGDLSREAMAAFIYRLVTVYRK